METLLFVQLLMETLLFVLQFHLPELQLCFEDRQFPGGSDDVLISALH